jgi:hypothetical protein
LLLLPELESRLFFNAPKYSFRHISLGGNNRNPTLLDGMLELLVAAGLPDLEPAVLLKPADNLPAVYGGAPSAA